MSNSLRPHGLYSPWNSPGLNTGVSSLSFLQGIFPSQGLNSGLPQCGQIFYQLSHQGSPRILEWEAYPFSRGSSQPSNWTGVSRIAGRFFTNWATREALRPCKDKYKLKRKYLITRIPHKSGIIQSLSFWVWLIWPSAVSSRLAHPCWSVCPSGLRFSGLHGILLCVYAMFLLIHSAVPGCLGCFRLSVIVNSAATDTLGEGKRIQ